MFHFVSVYSAVLKWHELWSPDIVVFLACFITFVCDITFVFRITPCEGFMFKLEWQMIQIG